MRKLIKGIVEFQRKVKPAYRETFARLALGQTPDALLIACCDSRVVPNLFASADPGDLFVVRNIGNIIAPAGRAGRSKSDESEAAAIEFALDKLHVTDIIVCGHSECGAMHALLKGRKNMGASHLRSWLRHAEPALGMLKKKAAPDPRLAPHNRLSQLNVLTQIEHLKTYSIVRKRLERGRVRLHGWWFDIRHADVYAFEPSCKRFMLINRAFATRLQRQLRPD